MVESPHAVAAGDVARDAVENAFWDDNDDVGEGETDADVAITDASPALISRKLKLRAKTASSFYNKFASDVVALGIWTPEKDGHPIIEESYERRTSFTESGENKGKSPLFTKHAEIVKIHFGEQKKASNSTASALSKNNKIWTAQLLLKHGNEQQRDKAMQILMKNLEEEDEAPC
eukprot:jgi/Tetstr1/444178/TSEL_032072.t1